MLNSNITRKAVEAAKVAANASLQLSQCMEIFQQIETEEDYFHCCNIHSALKETIDKANDKDSVILSELSSDMFTYLSQYEQGTHNEQF